MKILELYGDKTMYAIINRIIDDETETKTGLQERIYEVLPIKKLDFTDEDLQVIEITSQGSQKAQEREIDSIVLHIHEFRRIIDGNVVKTMRSYHIVPTLESDEILSEILEEKQAQLKKFRQHDIIFI